MSRVTVNETYLSDIADAIRSKNGTENTYTPAEMADAIEAISGGGITPTGTKQISITSNGTTTEDVTNYASAEITVTVPTGGGSTLGTKSITANGTYNASSDSLDGYSSVTVNVQGGGGSDQCVLLDTFTLNGENSLQVDVGSDWSNYDAFLLVPNVTLSEADWLYLAVDASGGGRYTPNEIAAASTDKAMYIYKDSGNYKVYWIAVNASSQFSSYLFIHTYRANKTMTGTWKLYGMKA